MSSGDKTQTAVHAPLSSSEPADVAVLVMQGSAPAPGLPPSRRLVLVRQGLDIGRTPAGDAEAGDASARGAAGASALGLGDPLVSASHARITRAHTTRAPRPDRDRDEAAGDKVEAPPSACYEIADLGSKNGTFVDGVRVDRPARLRDGAVVFLGDHVGVFRLVTARALDAIQAELAAPLGPVATASASLALACDRMRRLAPGDGELMLLGETGVGKEVYARAVHRRSGRRGRFVPINCGAIPRDLVESELFGFRAGAHSTAHAAKLGLIEEAEGGTLFLDEVGEMPPGVQIKLLRFLQDRELTPLGSTRPRKIDVRVIAATNRIRGGAAADGDDEDDQVDEVDDDRDAGRVAMAPVGLREDILGRLAVSPIELPPLRERLEDLGALVAHFLRDAATRSLDQAAFRALALHSWPLNVRELEKSLTTAAVLAAGERPIGLRDLPAGMSSGARTRAPSRAPSPSPSPSPRGSQAERAPSPLVAAQAPTATPTAAQIEELLGRHHGNVAEVARALGKQRAAVWRWMKKWGIGVERFRRPD